MPVFTQSLSVFACLSKVCAPPPAGKGGSLPQAHGSVVTMEDVVRGVASGASSEVFNKAVFDDVQAHQSKGQEVDEAGKVLANGRVMKHLLEDEGYQKWRSESGYDDRAAALEVKHVIDQWAKDSSPSTPFALASHRAAAAVHGLGDAYESVRAAASSETVKGSDDLYGKYGGLYEAIVRSEYKATQEWFKERGIKELMVHRGMAISHDQSVGDVVRAQMYPLSSWSELHNEAVHFSKPYGDKSKRRLVLSARVPVELVQSIPATGRGCLMEWEFVLVGQPTEALVSYTEAKPA